MSDTGSQNNQRNGPSQHAIMRRGLSICQKDGQIKAPGGDRWDVASQGVNNEWRRVSMSLEGPTCECKCHAAGSGLRCKYIAEVEQMLSISSKPAPG